MKLSEFILLNEEDKKMTVLHLGVLVAKRNVVDSMVFLFQMEAYYVEAFCNTRNKAIEEYRVFDDVEQLGPYLEAIPIDHLMN
jgi:hypothetical protein